MVEKYTPQEETIAEMMRLAYDVEHRPSVQMKERTLALLLAAMQGETNQGAFPAWAQSLLTISLGLLAAGLAFTLYNGRFACQAQLQVLLAAVIVAANLFFAPVAGITIILRRHHG